jgi:hypothetical protein
MFRKTFMILAAVAAMTMAAATPAFAGHGCYRGGYGGGYYGGHHHGGGFRASYYGGPSYYGGRGYYGGYGGPVVRRAYYPSYYGYGNPGYGGGYYGGSGVSLSIGF